ncbi:MAG TPA: ferrous iron transport protein B [Firmicutes bacterium]|nr:ferrous iron transport protein B [Bacillota bacterium]
MAITIALAGNPNTGKSTIFNSLTGLNQHTGNWPGKTVANALGRFTHNGRNFMLVDLPGTYSLFASSLEEQIARDFICNSKPDATVVVTDATCLERNLNLVLQILAITPRVIVCVNLIDEAKRKGIELDLRKLEDLLGVPVVGTVARSKKGLEQLKDTIEQMVSGTITLKPIQVAASHAPDGSVAKSAAEDDKFIASIVQTAEEIARQVVSIRQAEPHQTDRKLDNILTSRHFGIPIMLALLGLVFWITIAGANYPSALLADWLFWIEDRLSGFLMRLPNPVWLHDLVVLGSYRTLAWVVSVMLPPMAIFFPIFTLLEDLGYLPRVAFNLDYYFKKACAHGKQALTMCMGFGCNAAGVTACRIIESPRERLIAVITNNFVPCNGRFPTIIALVSIFTAASAGVLGSLTAAFFVLASIVLGVVITLLISRLLSLTFLKGIPSSFILELPPYRKPQIGKVIVRSLLDRTLYVLGRAVAIAAPAGVVIWIMANVLVNGQSLLAHSADFLDPFARLIGLDGYILMAFILGLPANETVIPILIMSYLATGSMLELDNLAELHKLLVDNGWTWLTAVCTILFSLNHWPCGTTLWTIYKETQSWKWTWVSFAVPTITGFFLCLIVAQGVRFLGFV